MDLKDFNKQPQKTDDQIARDKEMYDPDPQYDWDDSDSKLKINGISFNKLYDFCKQNNLPTNGDIYDTVMNFKKDNKND